MYDEPVAPRFLRTLLMYPKTTSRSLQTNRARLREGQWRHSHSPACDGHGSAPLPPGQGAPAAPHTQSYAM